MNNKTQEKQIDEICHLMTEMAVGNFSYQMRWLATGDYMDKLGITAKMTAENLRDMFLKIMSAKYQSGYRTLEKLTLVLDEDFKVINFTSRLPALLKCTNEEMINCSLTKFLSEDSKPVWETVKTNIGGSGQGDYHEIVPLKLISEVGLYASFEWSISKMAVTHNAHTYTLTAFETIFQPKEKEEALRKEVKDLEVHIKERKKQMRKMLIQATDRENLEKVYQRILNNPAEKLPSLKQIALDSGTNEYKLKIGFKQFYGTTVFEFQREMRLKLAQSYIINSNIPLSRVSELCGFSSYPHFSKLFKVRFKYNAYALRKRSLLKSLEEK